MPAEPRSLKELFLAALAVAPAERAAWLESACGQDADLRRRVELMVAAHDSPQSLLDGPAPADEVATNAFDAARAAGPPGARREQAGATIAGRYKLVEEIGEGGMGTVWMAQQTEPMRRLVAVKLIKPGMDSKQVLARFEAERQALAIMDHPNIARVLDAGTTPAGRPYFVMELVKGVPITRYCDEHHLTPRQRLELFVPVCQAIQHAHQKGIIHRDVKPSNVLVSLYDGRPVPKVIDFGIAKATGQPLTERTLVTGFGTVVGTLEYMSPEQAELNQLDVDTRSDVYSLGVLLYELLTGSTPLEKKRLKQAAMLEVLRLIREEDPPRPSTRLSTTDEMPSVAANRGLEPKKLSALVRGELDWIVMRALEKDRNRRYETANDFAHDVQRYLDDEPVVACPSGVGYRLRKLVRRHKGPVLAAGVFVLLLVAGVVGTSVGLARALEAEGQARDTLLQVTDEQAKTQAALTAETAAKAQTREALDALTEDVVETMFARQPELEEADKAFLRKVLGFYEAVTRQLGETDEAQMLRAKGSFKVAYLRALLGERIAAEAGYRQAVTLLGQLAARHPGVAEYRQKQAASHNNLGVLLAELGKEGEADTAFRAALALRKALTDKYPNDLPYRRELAASYNDLGFLLQGQKKYADAETAYRLALDEKANVLTRAGAVPADRLTLARSRSNLGNLLRERQKYAEAEAAYREALSVQQKLVKEFQTVPRGRRELADSLHGLGIVLAEMEKEGEAMTAFRDALDLREKLARDFPNVLQYRRELANGYYDLSHLLWRQRNVAEAEKAGGRALELRKQLVAKAGPGPRDRQDLARSYHDQGNLLRVTDRPKEAEQAWIDALALRKRLVIDFPRVADYRNDLAGTLGNLAMLHNLRQEFDAALALLAQARPHLQAALEVSPKNPAYRLGYRNHLQALARSHMGRADHARLATTADELARFGYDPPNDCYLAACCLCSCGGLADKDARLTDAQGKGLAQGYADRALARLHQAVEAGFHDAAHMKNNPDFEQLRAREAFRKLIAALERTTQG